MPLRKWKEIQTVLWKKDCIIFADNYKMKEVNKVVLLDELKQTLTAYEEPLKDLRDSL